MLQKNIIFCKRSRIKRYFRKNKNYIKVIISKLFENSTNFVMINFNFFQMRA